MMPQKLVKVARLLVLGLGVVIFATFKNAAIAGEEDLCSAMGYVDIVTKRVPLKAHPSQKAHSVVLIHKNQYVCILEQKSVAVHWIKVKAVPLADGSHGFCYPATLQSSCRKIGNFPAVWLSRKPQGSTCQLLVESDSEGNLVTRAKGVCATGWLQRKYVHQIAD